MDYNQSNSTPNGDVNSNSSTAHVKKAFNPDNPNARKLITAIVAITTIALITGLYIAHNNKTTNPALVSYHTYDVSKMNTMLVPGSKPGKGIKLSLPVGFSAFGTAVNTNNQKGFISFVKNPKDSKQTIAVARVVADSYNFSSPSMPDADFYKQTNELFSLNPSGSDYQAGIKSLYFLAKQAFPEKSISVKIAGAKPFTNSYIRKYAWQIDMTASDSKALTPDHQGKILWIGGNNGFYHLLVAAADNDWNNEPNVWQAIINSVQVNQ